MAFSIAVVGYGGMGGWHADIIRKIEGLSLRGIYDIDNKRSLLAQERGIRSYDSFEELLRDDEIDLVTVATPNDAHKPIVIAALEAGKNVVCEKPVSIGAVELEEMIAAAKKSGKVFSVHQNRRWDEDYLTVKKLYDEVTLGKIFNIESRVHGSRGIPGDWRNQKAHGGGMLYDWGVHLIDQILCMLPGRKLESLYATLGYVTNTEVDDNFRVQFNYDDGLVVLVEVGTSNFISLPRWYVQGENGTAIIRDWSLNGETVMVSDWQKRDAVPVVTAAGLTKTMAPRTNDTIKTYPLPKVKSDIRDYYANIRDAVLSGAELIVKPCEVLRTMRVIDAVFISAEQNRVVYLNGDYTVKE